MECAHSTHDKLSMVAWMRVLRMIAKLLVLQVIECIQAAAKVFTS
jgi:hypothetical protein